MLRRADIKRVIYGTARLGNSDYGFSNNIPLDFDERIHLINKIIELGISRFDTSPRYKNAELILGKAISKLTSTILIDTKVVDLIPYANNSEKIIFQQVEKSLKTLNKESINVLYLHQNEIEIISDINIQKSLNKLLDLGLVKKIGISVYNHNELDYGLRSTLFNVIQAPVNVLNHSFYNKFINSNKASNKELVARSIFLQGALLNVGKNKLNKLNLELSKKIKLLNEMCTNSKTTIENQAKYSVFELSDISVIQSSLSLNNISSNLIYQKDSGNNIVHEQVKKIMDSEYSFTNPRNWNY
mgnify:CR=1 FL=1